MNCPVCDSQKTRNIRTRRYKDAEGDTCIRRRHECLDCKHRFVSHQSYERADTEAIFRGREAYGHLKKAEDALKPLM